MYFVAHTFAKHVALVGKRIARTEHEASEIFAATHGPYHLLIIVRMECVKNGLNEVRLWFECGVSQCGGH